MNPKLNWPTSLSEITLKNINTTELWFLREALACGNYDMSIVGYEVRTPKFGYEECYIDISDTRYLVKYKTWAYTREALPASHPAPGNDKNIIFYVQKHLNAPVNPIGK